MKPEQTIDFHLKKTWQAIAKMYNEEAAKYGATMAEGYVLLSIDLEKGTPSTALGPKMGMESTSLSRIVKNLEGRGLIERRANPQDRRSMLVHLTPSGLEKRAEAKAAVIAFNEAIFEELPDEKLTHFFDVIQAIDRLVARGRIFRQTV